MRHSTRDLCKRRERERQTDRQRDREREKHEEIRDSENER